MEAIPATIKVKAVEATVTSFKEYGQVVDVSADGQEFGHSDAQLDLSRGTPRSQQLWDLVENNFTNVANPQAFEALIHAKKEVL